MTARGNELECISTIEPGAVINIPLKAVYTPTNELFFSVPAYSVTSTPFIWKDLQLNLSITKVMHCTPKTAGEGNEPFVIKVSLEFYYSQFNNSSILNICRLLEKRNKYFTKIQIDIPCQVPVIIFIYIQR